MDTKQQRPNRNRRGRRDDTPSDQQWQEEVMSVDRVARVVKGGRRFRFRGLVAVGDGKGKIGVGVAKGTDVQMAITKAVAIAKKSLVTVPLAEGTIPHEVTIKHGGARVMIKPAAPGTGVIAGGVVRVILETAGVQNVLSKIIGSSSKINNAYATIKALQSLSPKSEWLTTRTRSDTKRTTVTTKAVAKPKPRKSAAKPKAPTKTKPPAKRPAAKGATK